MKIANYFLASLLPMNSFASHEVLPGLLCDSVVVESDDKAQLCVINLFGETEWFVFSEMGNQRLETVPNSMSMVSEFVLSPSQHYVAIISVGEGHPIIDLIELKNLLYEKEPNILMSINPYPGTINIDGWADEKLHITSDTLLTDKNQNLITEGKFEVDIAQRKITTIFSKILQ